MNLPVDFVQRIHADFGAEASAFLDALQAPSQVSVRVNPAKVSSARFSSSVLERVPWSSWGAYLKSRPCFTLDPLFNAGAYYVQEAGSMLVEAACRKYLSPSSNPLVLDLCAAPGGKSTLLSSFLGNNGLLVANEYVARRVAPLRENLTKWGAANTVVTNSDAASFGQLQGLFDCMVVDAPCSGEGMFRKEEVAVFDWSPSAVRMCRDRQRQILSDVFPALKEGGLLIYSTCTFNEEEDEQNAQWIASSLGAELLPLDIEEAWHVVGSSAGYHTYPYKAKAEGFFISVLRKTSPAASTSFKSKVPLPVAKWPAAQQFWLLAPESFAFLQKEVGVVAFPSRFLPVLQALYQKTKVVQAGVALAQMKGKDWIPSPAFALSSSLNREAFPQVSVDWSQAMAFLRRENIVLKEAPKGWVLITFSGVPLGWVKNLGSRSNNAYPAEWHVRMSPSVADYSPLF